MEQQIDWAFQSMQMSKIRRHLADAEGNAFLFWSSVNNINDNPSL